jgi:lipase maturation factor 1
MDPEPAPIKEGALTIQPAEPGDARVATTAADTSATKEVAATGDVGTAVAPAVGPETSDDRVVRLVFLRSLGAVHVIAFVSLWSQIHGLIGEQGILPVGSYLHLAVEKLGRQACWKLPTLCWLNSSDAMLTGLCASGTLLSLLLIAGLAPRLVLFGLWLIYLSLSVAGQAFLSFQWDTLLLETTFCSILYAPAGLRPKWRDTSPSPIARWVMWGLAFKLMFLSGVTKLLSGDSTWLDGTALNFHYVTQPIPSWPSWYAHHLPPLIQRFSLIVMLVVELPLPFLIFAGRWGRASFAAGVILLMLAIEATGNFGFFNLLTIVLCLPLLDDRFLMFVVTAGRRSHLPPSAPLVRSKARTIVERSSGIAFLSVSLLTLVHEMVRTQQPKKLSFVVTSTLTLADRALLSWGEPWILEWVRPFRTINGYGLFRVMTTRRPEIVVEISDDGRTWTTCEFRYKPGRVDRAPAIVAPHMPRLDWQMWFAALDPRGNGYWLSSLAMRILEGNQRVAGLMSCPEIAEHPPKYVRMAYYDYAFASPDVRRQTGAWWFRTRLGELTGPITKSD